MSTDWLIVGLTLVLVLATIWYAKTTSDALEVAREANEEARRATREVGRANEIAIEALRFERQRSRGANVLVWAVGDRGQRGGVYFGVNVRGPSSANFMTLRLEVNDEQWGHEVVPTDFFELGAGARNTFAYQLFAGRDGLKREHLDGETGYLRGTCWNDDLEVEEIESFPFLIHCPAKDGLPITFQPLSKHPQ